MKEEIKFEVQKSDSIWKAELDATQYHILREKGTEYPFTGKFDKFYEPGSYHCAACGQKLFESDTKYNSGCGWPAFTQPLEKEAVVEIIDSSLGMIRTEVQCAKCGGHLGHVFNDGPKPAGLRYCINSASLEFIPIKK
ncbi:MAG: peptide-methionine (R)-S-oxide reductase MsrB [Bacteroidales bacterium]|nr:peptide-methionine (R)-S-oxide reductase MsrB [Bacteroidales bacterium]